MIIKKNKIFQYNNYTTKNKVNYYYFQIIMKKIFSLKTSYKMTPLKIPLTPSRPQSRMIKTPKSSNDSYEANTFLTSNNIKYNSRNNNYYTNKKNRVLSSKKKDNIKNILTININGKNETPKHIEGKTNTEIITKLLNDSKDSNDCITSSPYIYNKCINFSRNYKRPKLQINNFYTHTKILGADFRERNFSSHNKNNNSNINNLTQNNKSYKINEKNELTHKTIKNNVLKVGQNKIRKYFYIENNYNSDSKQKKLFTYNFNKDIHIRNYEFTVLSPKRSTSNKKPKMKLSFQNNLNEKEFFNISNIISNKEIKMKTQLKLNEYVKKRIHSAKVNRIYRIINPNSTRSKSINSLESRSKMYKTNNKKENLKMTDEEFIEIGSKIISNPESYLYYIFRNITESPTFMNPKIYRARLSMKQKFSLYKKDLDEIEKRTYMELFNLRNRKTPGGKNTILAKNVMSLDGFTHYNFDK